MTTAAAVATCTETIRLGTFIVILPYQHPILLAEEVANVDILSNGRFEFGVGQGYSYRLQRILYESLRAVLKLESIQLIEKLLTQGA